MEKLASILFLSAEAAPLAKVGGLADVAGSLPRVLQAMGHDVRLFLPMHPNLRSLASGERLVATADVPSRRGAIRAEGYLLEQNGVPVYLVDGPLLRESDSIYHSDSGLDAPKFVFFSLAALELARALNWRPSVVHTQEWHCAAANCWLAGPGRSDSFFAAIPSILSLHNLPYLGERGTEALALFDLGLERPESVKRNAGLPDWARTMLLPLGIAAADQLTAVSPTYAEEILTPRFGHGLETYLRTQTGRIRGILNGLDTEQWDPSKDPHLGSAFDVEHLERRDANKSALQKELGLKENPGVLLAGIVSRLDAQKGIDLALAALDDWCSRGNQVAILGAGDPRLESECSSFADRFPGRAAVQTGFNAKLASRIYAGADVFLMPSRYEPCGISQMIAMRYGCLPVACAVGGLKDTIRDMEQPRGTGFLFEERSQHALAAALWRAEALHGDPRRWNAAKKRAMKTLFSWKKSAKEYESVYADAIRSRVASDASAEQGE